MARGTDSLKVKKTNILKEKYALYVVHIYYLNVYV